MKKSTFFLILYVLSGLAVLAFLIKEALGNGDFKVFLEAGRFVAEGDSPYDYWHPVSKNSMALYFYSPFWAVLMVPLTWLPQFVANLLWLLASTWFLYRCWVLLTSYLPWETLSQKHRNGVLIFTLVLSIRFVLYNFGMIQMTIFLLWSGLESLHLFQRKRFRQGGLLLALAINIKLLPLVLVPYLLYRKQFSATAYTVLFSLLSLLIPALFVGWDFNILLHSEWWKAINPTKAEHLVEADIGLHSLTALIPTLLTETEGRLPLQRYIINLPIDTAILVLNGCRMALIAGVLFFLKWPPFKPASNRLLQLRELSYLFLLIPLIFPHQQKYAFFLMAPALFYLVYYLVEGWNTKDLRWRVVAVLVSLAFGLTTLTTDGLIGRDLNKITQHYKLITYGALLLIPAIGLASPKKELVKSTLSSG